MYCFAAIGFRRAISKAAASVALIDLKSLTKSIEIVIFASAFNSSYMPIIFSDSRGR